jgi:hypothetical protein
MKKHVAILIGGFLLIISGSALAWPSIKPISIKPTCIKIGAAGSKSCTEGEQDCKCVGTK